MNLYNCSGKRIVLRKLREQIGLGSLPLWATMMWHMGLTIPPLKHREGPLSRHCPRPSSKTMHDLRINLESFVCSYSIAGADLVLQGGGGIEGAYMLCWRRRRCVYPEKRICVLFVGKPESVEADKLALLRRSDGHLFWRHRRCVYPKKRINILFAGKPEYVGQTRQVGPYEKERWATIQVYTSVQLQENLRQPVQG